MISCFSCGRIFGLIWNWVQWTLASCINYFLEAVANGSHSAIVLVLDPILWVQDVTNGIRTNHGILILNFLHHTSLRLYHLCIPTRRRWFNYVDPIFISYCHCNELLVEHITIGSIYYEVHLCFRILLLLYDLDIWFFGSKTRSLRFLV